VQIGCRVSLGASGNDGIGENLPGHLFCPVRRFDHTAPFNLAQHPQQFRCGNVCHRPCAYPWIQVVFQLGRNPLGMARRPIGAYLGEPFTPDHLKAVFGGFPC